MGLLVLNELAFNLLSKSSKVLPDDHISQSLNVKQNTVLIDFCSYLQVHRMQPSSVVVYTAIG